MDPQKALQILTQIANEHLCNANDRRAIDMAVMTIESIVKNVEEQAATAANKSGETPTPPAPGDKEQEA